MGLKTSRYETEMSDEYKWNHSEAHAPRGGQMNEVYNVASVVSKRHRDAVQISDTACRPSHRPVSPLMLLFLVSRSVKVGTHL